MVRLEGPGDKTTGALVVPRSGTTSTAIGCAIRVGHTARMPADVAPQLFLVDVFAERRYAGNQLAVVVGYEPREWPTERMQAFAREMNFSETTFAMPSPRDGAYDVRIFTPASELPFAGHPTLGTSWVLRRFF